MSVKVPNSQSFYVRFVKRFFDIIIGIVALPFLAVVVLVVGLAIKCDDGGPVFYRAKRIGKNSKIFNMYKFRSMIVNAPNWTNADGSTYNASDDARVTKVGKFIRKTSIDELPQLWNIIKGDMSIIGPRPPLVREVKEYTPYHMHRLDVKTGLSCYRECYGRSNIHDFDEWVESDLKYIRERSLWVDLKVILLTIKVVLTGDGAM